jgi:GDPmannose 4,6-dehydratase
MQTRKSCLIVGHTGQDGVLLSKHLATSGYEVSGFSSRECSCGVGTNFKAPDIRDRDSMFRIVDALRPDEVYYLAAAHRSSESRDGAKSGLSMNDYYEVNSLGFLNLLEAVKTCSPRARVFYAASSLLYAGNEDAAISESTPISPSGFYGLTKALGAQMAAQYRQHHDMYVVVGMLFNHESHLRRPEYLSRRVIEGAARVARGEIDSLSLGDIRQRVDWSHAEDFVRGFHLALQCHEPRDYVFASGKARTVEEFVAKAFEAFGLDWQRYVRVEPGRAAIYAPPRIGDPALLMQKTGWHPNFSFDSMIAEICRHFAQRGS